MPDSSPPFPPGRETPDVRDGALVLGWYHSTRSVAAHCFEGDRPLCQDSDPGEIVDHNKPGRLIGRTCEGCRAIYKSRILGAIKRRELAARRSASTAPSSS